VDSFPTLVALAGGSPSPERQKLPLDGRDLWPTLTAGQPTPHDEIVLNTAPGGGAIRVGEWKLNVQAAINVQAAKPKSEQVELFNVVTDIGETNALAASNPEKVKAMLARYDRWAQQAAPPKNGAAKENDGKTLFFLNRLTFFVKVSKVSH